LLHVINRLQNEEKQVQIGRIIPAAVISVALVATGIGAEVASAAQLTDPNAAVVHQSTQRVQDVQSYWTPARLKAAKPVPEPKATPSGRVPAQSHRLAPKAAAGGAPAKAAKSVGGTVRAADITQSDVWGTHGQMPATTVGKLYFTTPQGNSECTASVVSSGNHDMIWTAGHCVTDGARNWYNNFQFVPDYHDGSWPLGGWVWKSASTPTAYLDGANSDYDLAAISLWPQGSTKVADVTGYQGYKFNYGYNWYVYEFGYPYDTHPARSGINGQQLRYCIAGTWQAGNQEAIHCDQGHGASGGPWLDDLQLSRGWGYLVGNVSYHPSDSSDEERSPHFGDAAVNVYNAQTNV
jgi:V8-like Glu-specific endopeptidase